MLAATRYATLASVDHDGRPLLAHVCILDDGSGAPVTVLSNLAAITLRARQDARSGMSIGERLVLQGDLAPVPGLQQLALQPALLASHPNLREPMESLDYSWLRLIPSRVQWIDDDGSSHWLMPADLANAEPDPLSGLDEFGADRAALLVAEVADRLDDDILLLVQGLVGRWRATWARLSSVDRYGLVVELAEPPGNSITRIPFPRRLDRVDELHAAVAGLRASALETPTARAQGRGKSHQEVGRQQTAAPTSPDELLQAIEAEALGAESPASDSIAPETPIAQELLEPIVIGAEVPESDAVDASSDEDYSWALWPGDASAFAGEASLLEGVERDRRGRSDVDGVDVPGHRNSYSLMDSLERAGREARALAAQEEGDTLASLDDDIGDVDRRTSGVVGITGGEREEPDAGVSEHVESTGERIESGVGEGVGLTHRDPA